MNLIRSRFKAPLLFYLVTALACSVSLTTMRAQDKDAGEAEPFVLDFDVLFDLKKPCDLTPALLESRAAALAVIPDEKLCRPVKFPREQCHYHWFSVKSSPRHNPLLSIFKSHIRPEFLSVVWQEEEMERFYCTYLAEKDQELPPQLLADMDASLGAAHRPSTHKKNAVEWNMEHYRVTAEYSTSVGKGDPRFLINVWNKAYKSKPASAISDNSSSGKAGSVATEIDLDQIIDWKNPLDLTRVAFEALMKPYAGPNGSKTYAVDKGGATGDAFVINLAVLGRTVPMKMLGGRFHPEGLRVEWTNGKASRINVIYPRAAEVHTVDQSLVTALDAALGKTHVLAQGVFDDLHTWSFSGHRVDYSAHKEQLKFYLSFYAWNGAAPVAASPPASPQGKAQAAPSSPSTASTTASKTVDIDPLLNWENPLALKAQEVETILKPQVDAVGSKFWHDHDNESTVIGAQGITKTAFGGRIKIASANIFWKEPKSILLEVESQNLSAADEEWLYGRLDELLKTERRRMNFTDSSIIGHEWSARQCRLITNKRPGSRFSITVLRPRGFDPSDPTEPLAANLDALLNFATLWSTSADAFDQLYTAKAAKKEDQKKPPQFEWMNAEKTRARFSRQMFSNVDTKLSMFAGSIKVEEAVLEFVNGKAARSTISFYNRGDSGEIEVKEFDRIFKLIGQSLGQVLKVAPKRQLNSTNAALPVAGWMWTTPQATALLEYNEYQVPGKVIKPEFLRLKIAAPGQSDHTMGKMVTGVQSMELVKRVTKKPDGEVYITGVPMVDQGQKGYCVAASCQRLFEYMRIPCDQHEMAQLVQVDADSGANVFGMQKSLAKIDGRFKVSFKPLVNPEQYYLGTSGKRRISDKEFNSIVKEYVNKGIPLLWALELGKAQEEPPLPGSGQTRGGHMRMIIGYRMENNLVTKILFTDSWGAGHELKRMSAYDAYDVTIGLYSMAPRGL